MADGPFALQLQDGVDDAVFLHGAQIAFLIDAVDEAEIDMVGLQLIQLPGNGCLDLLWIGGPAILPAGVVRAEMDLQIDLIPALGNGLPHA